MNRIAAILFAFTLAVVAGCTHTLPKPTNANGSINPSVAMAEAEISYANAAHAATAYIANCHAVPTTLGCSEQKIQQIKVADQKAYTALQSAESAVKTLPAGAEGIDKAIATLNAALVFLQSFITPPAH